MMPIPNHTDNDDGGGVVVRAFRLPKADRKSARPAKERGLSFKTS